MGVGAPRGRLALAQVVSRGCLVSCRELGTPGKGARMEGGHTKGRAQQVRTWGTPTGTGGTPQERNGLSWPGQGGSPTKDPPRTWTGPPRKGESAWTWGDPPGRKEGTWGGGSECQDMGDPPPHLRKGGSAWEEIVEHPEKGRPRGLSWAGHEGPPGKGEGSAGLDMGTPSWERGFTRPGLRGTSWGDRECGVAPWERGGSVFVGMADTPESGAQGGLGRSGFRVCSGKRGAQLSQPSQGLGVPQERGFSFPGRRRTQTRAFRRGSQSS